MSRFRYWRDPLFLLCCGLYGLNRFYLKSHLHSAFLHSYFNDLLLVPCALPLLLGLHRLLRLRRHDAPPTFWEITSHLAVWSVLFEVIGPNLFPGKTADAWDVVVYLAGGIAAFAVWHWRRGHNPVQP